MSGAYDVIVIGAGIVGLAHAYEAARMGLRTLVLERGAKAEGASVRNFGLVWVIGQRPGQDLRRALRGRETWLTLCREGGLWHRESGSVLVATAEDEAAVLREFAAAASDLGHEVRLLDRTGIEAMSPGVRPGVAINGLYSPRDVCLNPREAIVGLARMLAERHGVEFRFATRATGIEPADAAEGAGPRVRWVSREGAGVLVARRVLVCAGHEAEALYPSVLARAGVRLCKLRMLALRVHDGLRLGPALAGGLSLRHYPSFEGCPSLGTLRERIARERPALDRFGVHVLAAQHTPGEIILGDSHEYDDAVSPFDEAEIESIILDEAARFIDLHGASVTRRWQGMYAKCPGASVLTHEVGPGVRLVAAVGGAGMTLAFPIAAEWRESIEGSVRE